ncbi:MAG: response regulator [Candidatus Binatia bacterium]
MIKILIVDDHAIVRQGLKQTVADEPDMKVAGEARNGDEALALVRNAEWDVVVLDVTMPGRSGLEVLKTIKQEKPRLPVLMLSMHPEEEFAIRAFRIGAAGYATKDSAPEELIAAIRTVRDGRKYVNLALAEKLTGVIANANAYPPHMTLSNREHEVFRLLISGKTVSEVADNLMLSVKTISTYRTRILGKLNVKNNAELMYYAARHQLIELGVA